LHCFNSQEKDGAPEEQPFFTDRIKVKHGVIIIDNPGETAEDTNIVSITKNNY
jgi:hypothetical protein